MYICAIWEDLLYLYCNRLRGMYRQSHRKLQCELNSLWVPIEAQCTHRGGCWGIGSSPCCRPCWPPRTCHGHYPRATTAKQNQRFYLIFFYILKNTPPLSAAHCVLQGEGLCFGLHVGTSSATYSKQSSIKSRDLQLPLPVLTNSLWIKSNLGVVHGTWLARVHLTQIVHHGPE